MGGGLGGPGGRGWGPVGQGGASPSRRTVNPVGPDSAPSATEPNLVGRGVAPGADGLPPAGGRPAGKARSSRGTGRPRARGRVSSGRRGPSDAVVIPGERVRRR